MTVLSDEDMQAIKTRCAVPWPVKWNKNTMLDVIETADYWRGLAIQRRAHEED